MTRSNLFMTRLNKDDAYKKVENTPMTSDASVKHSGELTSDASVKQHNAVTRDSLKNITLAQLC